MEILLLGTEKRKRETNFYIQDSSVEELRRFQVYIVEGVCFHAGSMGDRPHKTRLENDFGAMNGIFFG